MLVSSLTKISLCSLLLFVLPQERLELNTKDIILKVIDIEGGYVNDPRDPGGETKYGISKRSYPKEDIKNLTKERAYEIYLNDYWNKVQADKFKFPLNLMVFDFAVNSGPSRAIKTLQMVVKTTQDGVLGPMTLKAVEAQDFEELCANYMTAREFFLLSLDKPHYIKGWTNRLFKVAFRCNAFG